jgi:hypothetical protein
MKIFISHAAVDRETAQVLVDLIRLGCDVPRGDIFFSSAHGDIPNGEFFVQRILTNLNQSQVFIGILSRAYMESKFCLGEIGAAQVRRIAGISNLYTLLVPPANFADLDAVLYGTQSGQILDGPVIDDLLDRIASGMPNAPGAAARGTERDKFLNSVRPLVGAQEARELVKELPTLDLIFERDESAHITYKMKLRMALRTYFPHISAALSLLFPILLGLTV